MIKQLILKETSIAREEAFFGAQALDDGWVLEIKKNIYQTEIVRIPPHSLHQGINLLEIII